MVHRSVYPYIMSKRKKDKWQVTLEHKDRSELLATFETGRLAAEHMRNLGLEQLQKEKEQSKYDNDSKNAITS